MDIALNGQIFKQWEDGSWTHSAEDSSILLKSDVKKQDGTLKAQYKDLPRYKLIVDYEDYFRAEWNETLRDTTKEALKFISKNF